MKIKQLGSNQTELRTDKAIVLFSYETPVAALVSGTFYRTNRKYSRTTSRHISQWLNGATAIERDPEWFAELTA